MGLLKGVIDRHKTRDSVMGNRPYGEAEPAATSVEVVFAPVKLHNTVASLAGQLAQVP
jgi:hypothetical protein